MMKLWNKFLLFWQKKLQPFFEDPLFLSYWVGPYNRPNETGRITERVGGGYRWVGHGYHGDLYMFIQDMYQGIMPLRHVGQRSAFTAHLDPTNPDLEAMIAEALESRGYSQDLTNALTEFINDATHSLFIYGQVIYEVIYEKDESGKITSLELVDVHPLSIKKILGHYFQIIPWWIAKHAHVKVGIKKIPSNKLVFIKFPKQLGGKRNLIKILKRLTVLGKELIPEFQMEAMKNNENLGFDFNEYNKTKYLEIAQLTKRLGWHQRKYQDNEILEYYSMHRHLHLAKSQAIIREHIVASLNNALNKELLDLGVQITMDNILMSQEVENEFKVLREGDTEFTELFKRTSL